MPTKPIPTDDSAALAVLDADDLYDTIMMGIEPELVSENLEFIKDAAKNETADERKYRAARYATAFAEYDRQLSAHKKQWDRAFIQYKKQSMVALEQHFAGTGLADIESNIANA